MKFWKLNVPLLVAAGGAAIAPALFAQGPLFDKVVVDFAHDTHISDQVVPAGYYEMQQIREPSSAARIMLVLKNHGRDYQASAITIPALNNNTPDATRAIIRRVGSNYYLDSIWIAGKNYGYQFEMPSEAKERIHEQAQTASLNLNYQAPQQAVAAAPAPAPPPPPAVVKEERREEAQVQVAQAPPPPARQPEAAPPPPPPAQTPAPAPEPAPAPAPTRLPQTSSGWANIFGFGVFATGLALTLKLRRRRA